MKRILLAVALAASLAACGGPTGTYGRHYTDEANAICRPRDGIISYSFGEDYDVAVCKDGTKS